MEDYTFCHLWRPIGGRLWLDTHSRLVHTGSREFAGDAAARFAGAFAAAQQSAPRVAASRKLSKPRHRVGFFHP